MNISAVISDSVLALATAYAAWRCYRSLTLPHWTVAAGLAIVSLAASLGVVRFLGVHEVARIHGIMSGAAAQVGNGLIATGLILLALRQRLPAVILAVFVVLVIVFLAGRFVLSPMVGISVGMAAVAGMLFAGFWMIKRAGNNALMVLFGAVMIPVAGLLVGTRGSLFHIHRSDIFHYVLAAAFLLIGLGASRITDQTGASDSASQT